WLVQFNCSGPDLSVLVVRPSILQQSGIFFGRPLRALFYCAIGERASESPLCIIWNKPTRHLYVYVISCLGDGFAHDYYTRLVISSPDLCARGHLSWYPLSCF